MSGKVLCLEQLFLRLLAVANPLDVRQKVCSGPDVDRALTICFSCASDKVDPELWREGLQSYINDLRNAAKTILAAF